MISAIVAVDNNWGIGYNGDLLEHIPEDLKHFKELTTDHVVVMGRKTWDSLPVKPLPERTNMVISHNTSNDFCFSRAQVVHQMQQRKDLYFFVIGGETIYKQFLPFCNRVYVTKIYKNHDNIDTYFPNLDESENWAPAMCSSIQTYKDLSYQFWEYDRIS